jgi:hypothetical protein
MVRNDRERKTLALYSAPVLVQDPNSFFLSMLPKRLSASKPSNDGDPNGQPSALSSSFTDGWDFFHSNIQCTATGNRHAERICSRGE